MPKPILSLVTIALSLGATASTAFAKGVPQLDPTWYPSQLFWLFISFSAMLIMVRAFIAPGITALLDHRKNSIETAIKEAEQYRARATQADEDMATAIHSAKADATHITQMAQTKIAEQVAETALALDQELKLKLTEAEKTLQISKASAMDELQEHAAEIAKAIVDKLLHSDIASADALNVTRRVS